MGVAATRIGPANRLTGRSGGWTPGSLSPTLWFDASSLSSASTTWTNQGTGGSALDGTFGATTAAPRVLTHTGTNYLYLPGVASNYASTPTSTVLDALTGDIEVVFRADVQAFTVSAGYLSRGGCWRVIADGTDGTKLRFGYWNGVSWSEIVSNTGLLQSGVRWYRVRRVVSSGVVTWETATDSTVEPSAGWSSFGSVALNAGTALPTAANPLEVGSRDLGAGPMTGSMYRAIVRNGIGGTTVFDADFTTGIASGAQTGIFDSSSNNAAVTINRSASGYKATAVVRPTLLFGGGQYVEVADNALLNFDASTSQTVLAVIRQWATPVSFGRFVDKALSASTGWTLSNSGTLSSYYAGISDGVNAVSRSNLSTYSPGALQIPTLRVDRTAQTLDSGVNGGFSATISTSTVGTITNTVPMRIGRMGDVGTGNQDFECIAVLVWRRALTAAEIQQVCDYYTYEGALAYTVGTLTTSAGYNVLTFNGSGTFTPGRNLPVEYLVVAGGGGGGGGTTTAFFGGGGGAGGYLTNVGTTKFVLPSTQQTITIGAGGAGGSLSGTTGNDSSIGGSIVARGGGFGGGTFVIGGNGGSGGGGGRQRAGGLPVAGQGNAGGTSNLSTFASGGGGAGTAGSNGSANTGGNGGNGLSSSISGASVTYAGGGGGSGFTTPGTGGTGGGANGAVDIVGNAGTANTGGGGGGTGSTVVATNVGGQGGSGIVIIRWPA